MKRKILTLTLALLLLLGCAIPALAAHAEPEATRETYIVEESRKPLDPEEILSKTGHLGLRGIPPVGFSGTIVVEIRSLDTDEISTVELTYGNMYINGITLPKGDYVIDRAYLKNGDHFYVDVSEIGTLHLTREKKTYVDLVIRVNDEIQEELDHIRNDFVPNPPAAEPTEASPAGEVTVPETTAPEPIPEAIPETATETTTPAEPESTAPSDTQTEKESSLLSKIVTSLAAVALFAGCIFGGVWLVRWIRSRNN